MFIRTALYLLLAYAALAAFMFLMQRRLLYLPSTESLSPASLHARGLAAWPTSGADYRGLIRHPPPTSTKGTVIVFHGNAGSAQDRSYYPHALERLDYRVLLAEYPGYGSRPGSPSEKTFVEDAKTTIQLAHQTFGSPIYLWGESLGAGVVAAAAADTTLPIDAVVLLTPWDSLPNLAQTLYWFLPARWLILDRYDNIQNLQSFPGRIAVIVAAQDEVIPVRHGLALYDSLLSPKRLWRFEQASHNTWPTAPSSSWWQDVMDYLTTP